jgi:hypothetical protein
VRAPGGAWGAAGQWCGHLGGWGETTDGGKSRTTLMGVPQVLSIIKKAMVAFTRLPPGRCCAGERCSCVNGQWQLQLQLAVSRHVSSQRR